MAKAGGTLHMPVPEGHGLTVFLEQSFSQDLDLRNNGILDAESLELSLDKLTLLLGQLRDRIKRCVQVDMGDDTLPKAFLEELKKTSHLSRKSCRSVSGYCSERSPLTGDYQ